MVFVLLSFSKWSYVTHYNSILKAADMIFRDHNIKGGSNVQLNFYEKNNNDISTWVGISLLWTVFVGSQS